MTLPEDYDKGKIIFGIRPLIPSLHVDARHVSAVASHGTASRFVGMSAIHMATITTIMSLVSGRPRCPQPGTNMGIEWRNV